MKLTRCGGTQTAGCWALLDMVAMRCIYHDGTCQVGSFYIRQPIRTPTLLQALRFNSYYGPAAATPPGRGSEAQPRSRPSSVPTRRSSSVRFAPMAGPVLYVPVPATSELRRTHLQRSYLELGIRAISSRALHCSVARSLAAANANTSYATGCPNVRGSHILGYPTA